MIEINDAEFTVLQEFLLTTCGIAVPPDKRYLFVTRLNELLRELGCRSFSEFYVRLGERREPQLRSRLVEAMTTNETGFFRDGHPYETLRRRILPELAERRAADARYLPPRLRVWSVGCSTGEEPYSIAMSIGEWLVQQERFSRNDVSILAVDISRRVLERARHGVYPPERLVGHLPDGYRRRYFQETRQGLQVRDDLRAMVFFGEVNLAESLERFGCFDLIFCRNVIIYFELELKRAIVEQFHRMLHPGGVLVLGASESLYKLSDRFETVHAGPTTYYRKADA